MKLKELEIAIKSHLEGGVPKEYEKLWKAAFNEKISPHAQVQRLKDLATMIGHGKHGFAANTGLQLAILQQIEDTYTFKDNRKMMKQTVRDIKTLEKMGVKAISFESSSVTQPESTPPVVQSSSKEPVTKVMKETIEQLTKAQEIPNTSPISRGMAQTIMDSAKFVAGDEFNPDLGLYAYNGANPHVMAHVWEDNGLAKSREVPLSESLDKKVLEQTALVAVRVEDPVRAILGSHDEDAEVSRAMVRNYLYMDSDGFRIHQLLEAEKNPQKKDFRENAAEASNDAVYAANDPKYGVNRVTARSSEAKFAAPAM